jgi:transcriptional regulator with XRE-family HTH domain
VPEPSTVGTRLRFAREVNQLTPGDVARYLGQPNTVQISRWEARSGPTPKSETLDQLAVLYGTTVAWLLRGEGALPVNKNVSRGTPLPVTPQEAVRRVRALAARLEADLHEWGASEDDFTAMRNGMNTDATVQMFRDGYKDRSADDVGTTFRRYELFVEAFRATLEDRIKVHGSAARGD